MHFPQPQELHLPFIVSFATAAPSPVADLTNITRGPCRMAAFNGEMSATSA
jgi:hypothetical protein